MRFLLIALLIITTLSPAWGEVDVSYRSLTKKEEEAAFYADGGRRFRNKRVHLHVPAARFLAKPTPVQTKDGRRILVLKNKSVPLVVSPRNVYVRKIRDRVDGSDRVCVKGTILPHPDGEPGKYALWVHSVKKAQ